MRCFGILLLWFTALVASADSTNETYIERYPGDGMGARDKKVPAKPMKDGPLMNLLPEKGESSTAPETVTTTTNKASRAARYISPRVGSKEFAPSRLPEPKMKTVVISEREGKYPPSPKVSDKLNTPPLETGSTSVSNQPPSAAP